MKLNYRGVVLVTFITFSLSTFLPFKLQAENHYRLVITGDMMGAINECDCPGGQPGGLARRKSIFDAIRKETPDAVFIDCGKLFSDNMSKEEIELSVDLLNLLDYDLIRSNRFDFDKLDSAKTLKALTDQEFSMFGGKLKFGWNGFQIWQQPNSKKITPKPDLSISIGIDNNKYKGMDFGMTFPLQQSDIGIFYDSGYTEPNVEVLHHEVHTGVAEIRYDQTILIAKPSMYGEHVLLLDVWMHDTWPTISRFEWQSIATETYPPDSTFQAKIDLIYKDKIDNRKR